MGELALTVAGKVYRVACDEGEEARLTDLASLVDAKISALKARFGEIGDQRLTLMVAISLADEWSEAMDRVRELEAEIGRLKSAAVQQASERPEWTQTIVQSLGEAARRIEGLTQRMNEASRD
ncbi:MAG: cell division protein ZapA [Alphaproteobacteria bacterium]|nr:cell division protein ZapA [Alphaproteobacteria bacterium]